MARKYFNETRTPRENLAGNRAAHSYRVLVSIIRAARNGFNFSQSLNATKQSAARFCLQFASAFRVITTIVAIESPGTVLFPVSRSPIKFELIGEVNKLVRIETNALARRSPRHRAFVTQCLRSRNHTFYIHKQITRQPKLSPRPRRNKRLLTARRAGDAELFAVHVDHPAASIPRIYSLHNKQLAITRLSTAHTKPDNAPYYNVR